MPMVEVGPRALLTRVTRELAQGMEVTHRTLPEGNGPRAAVVCFCCMYEVMFLMVVAQW